MFVEIVLVLSCITVTLSIFFRKITYSYYTLSLLISQSFVHDKSIS